jgi:hypothetical protein
MRILVAVESIDFRNGIDGLAGICKSTLQKIRFPAVCSSSETAGKRQSSVLPTTVRDFG